MALIAGPAGSARRRLLDAVARARGAPGRTVLTRPRQRARARVPVRRRAPAVRAAAGRRRRARAAARRRRGAGAAGLRAARRRRRRTASFAALHGLYWLTVNLTAERRCCWRSTTCTGATARRCASSPTSSARLEGAAGAGRGRAAAGRAGRRRGADGRDRRRPADHDAVGPRALDRGRGRDSCASASARTPTTRFCAACHAAPAAIRCCCASCSPRSPSEGVQPDAGNAGVVRELGPRAASRAVLLRLARLPGTRRRWRARSPCSATAPSCRPSRRARRAERGGG